MGYLSEKDFETKGDGIYSHVNYDLIAKTGLSVRKNFETNKFEIFKIKTGKVQYSYSSIHDIIRIINEIEGEENTFYR